MALNAQERAVAAHSVLECFGEDAEITGRFLAYLQARANISLLADVVTQSNTYQPFTDAGVTGPSLTQWQAELTRQRDLTLANLT